METKHSWLKNFAFDPFDSAMTASDAWQGFAIFLWQLCASHASSLAGALFGPATLLPRLLAPPATSSRTRDLTRSTVSDTAETTVRREGGKLRCRGRRRQVGIVYKSKTPPEFSIQLSLRGSGRIEQPLNQSDDRPGVGRPIAATLPEVIPVG